MTLTPDNSRAYSADFSVIYVEIGSIFLYIQLQDFTYYYSLVCRFIFLAELLDDKA